MVFRLSADTPGFSPIARGVYCACQTCCQEGRKREAQFQSSVLSTPFRVETESGESWGSRSRALFQSFVFIWLELEFCIVMLDFPKLYRMPRASKLAPQVKVLAASCCDLSWIPGTSGAEEETCAHCPGCPHPHPHAYTQSNTVNKANPSVYKDARCKSNKNQTSQHMRGEGKLLVCCSVSL